MKQAEIRILMADNINLISRQRLAKWIAHCGWCSRRAAERLISAGVVSINGKPGKHTDLVGETDQISIGQQPLPVAAQRQYWLYHKPIGVDCNNRPDDPASLYHVLMQLPQRLFAVGRLDKDSSGLLLLTNDGILSQQLMHPDHYHNKTYIVDTDKAINTAFVQQMAAGVSWTLGTKSYSSRPCQVSASGAAQFQIVLTEGQHRQIRYMCKTLGYRVTSLKRVALGTLQLADLPSGAYRPLTPSELTGLQRLNAQPKPQTQ
ncbi:pseudouridine synthase [Rheinheimera gaetbuli]